MRKARGPADWGFDRYDGGRLRRAMAGARDVRLFRRLQAVLLVRGGDGAAAAGRLGGGGRGWGAARAGRLGGASRRAVYDWVGAYLAGHRPADLADGPRSGRPPAAAGG